VLYFTRSIYKLCFTSHVPFINCALLHTFHL